MEAREAAVAELQAEHGAVLIPPYNYGPVMCGQGTMALELLRQVQHNNRNETLTLTVNTSVLSDLTGA